MRTAASTNAPPEHQQGQHFSKSTSQTADLTWGVGLHAQDGAQVDVARVLLRRNAQAGLQVSGSDARVVAIDLAVLDTRPAECAATYRAGAAAGTGMAALGGGSLDVTRFAVRDSAFCGLQPAFGYEFSGVRFTTAGTADLREGEIARNAAGVNVQAPGFDVPRLRDRVRFHDNGSNLDRNDLPVPPATAPTMTP